MTASSFVKSATALLLLCGIGISRKIEGGPFYGKELIDFGLDLKDNLRLFHTGNFSDYYISNYEADAREALQVCRNLTSLTGRRFRLLVVENSDEAQELQNKLESLGLSIWLGGEKTWGNDGSTVLVWNTDNGQVPITYKNFPKGSPQRRRRDTMDNIVEIGNRRYNSDGDSVTSVLLHRWYDVGNTEGSRCRNGKFTPPQCEPIECSVHARPCTTITPPCTIKNQTDCTVARPDCSAKCENCTVIEPICHVRPKPCEVKTGDCQIIRDKCRVTTFPCTTTRPDCIITQPPCEVPTPPSCTPKPPPPCIPTFRKDNCTTVQLPCEQVKNETICPPPRTVCEESYRCGEPEICQQLPIICPPPLIYCPPEETVCPPPKVECPKPVIYCPEPEVHCPLPDVICSEPQVLCSSPVVSCPGIITDCRNPQFECPAPIVDCPKPDVECTTPPPCEPDEYFPPCPTEKPPPPTTTTRRPGCPGCGCVFASKQHRYQWDIADCARKFHFICEG